MKLPRFLTHIVLGVPLIIIPTSCALNFSPLEIIDFQLETPSIGYTNTITHQCGLNYHNMEANNLKWKIVASNTQTETLIESNLININQTTGLLTIRPGIPSLSDNPYIFDIHASFYDQHNTLLEDLILKKYFNVSNYSKPTWGRNRSARWLMQQNQQLFANSSNGIKVADISHLQPNIDWDRVKQYSDIDAVILRCAHGTHLRDTNFGINVAALNRLNIPYGIYIYSAAASESDGIAEANMVDTLIKENNAHPTLPIFLDIEEWDSQTTSPDTDGATCPQDSATWALIWNGFYNRLQTLGYNSNQIYSYSYPAWANKVCEDPSVYSKLRWCARYHGNFDFNNFLDDFTVNQNDGRIFGWQYSESEIIPGINSNVTVDCSGFFNINNLF